MNLEVKKGRPMCYSQHNSLYHIIKRYFNKLAQPQSGWRMVNIERYIVLVNDETWLVVVDNYLDATV
jgi:hypothetical protein